MPALAGAGLAGAPLAAAPANCLDSGDGYLRARLAGAVEARITSSRKLNEVDRAQLEAQIAKLAGAHVRASYTEDPSLLGGAIVEIGSTIYDGSVRAQLQQLKQRLVNA